MAKRKACLLFVALSGVLLLLIGCGSSPETIRKEEKALLLTVQDIKPYDSATKNATSEGESFSAETYLNGSREIFYEYDFQNEAMATETLWMNSSVGFAETEDAASTLYVNRIEGYKAGFLIGGDGEITVNEDQTLYSEGDETYSAYLERKGQKVGNMIVVRQGENVFSLLLVGLYFDDPALVHELLAPKLEALDDWDSTLARDIETP